MYMVRELKPAPSLVKEYIYCPVIPWIINNYCVTEPPTDSMLLGKEAEEEKKRLYVRSRRYRLSTIIDEVAEVNGENIIIEYKRYSSKSIHRYIEQVKAEAYIARETIHRLRKAVLNVNGNEKVFEVSKEMLDDAERLFNRVEKTISREDPPPKTVYQRHCINCWYKRYCPYY